MKPLLILTASLFFVAFFGCMNIEHEKELRAPLTDSTSITGLTGDSAKLVKTASIDFKVKDVAQGTRDVSRLARDMGGMIYHQELQSVEGERKELAISSDSLMIISTFSPKAYITARVPSDHLEDFMFSIAELGYYTNNSELHIEDKSLTYLENGLKQKNREEELNRPVPPGKKAASTLQTISIKDEAIEKNIINRTIDADVHYSLVCLSLFQNPLVRKEMIANYHISEYQLPYSKKLGDAMESGWEFFLNFLIALAHLWVFILAGILLWLAYRYYQQKSRFT